ncbi:hypothetical protein EYF80_036198 [Liparis tanakae]|uniref:Uncharacterized protein n=1 Tax=Liparis tanakae TaxID=230148 RepID=A0A4Z2GLE5_9TELE|nr:hypothetical protein EYF80_036198 [Liparis tanakae]
MPTLGWSLVTGKNLRLKLSATKTACSSCSSSSCSSAPFLPDRPAPERLCFPPLPAMFDSPALVGSVVRLGYGGSGGGATKQQASHTNDCFVQILGLLPVGVTELVQHRVQGFGIRTVQDEMLQEPEEIVPEALQTRVSPRALDGQLRPRPCSTRGQAPHQMKVEVDKRKKPNPTPTCREGLQQNHGLVPVAALLARLPPVERVGRLGAELRVWMLSQNHLQLLEVVHPVQGLRCRAARQQVCLEQHHLRYH